MAISYPLRLTSIGILIETDHTITVFCYRQGCHHCAKLDLEALAMRLGRDYSTMHDDLARKFRCSKCGSKDIGLRLAPRTGVPAN